MGNDPARSIVEQARRALQALDKVLGDRPTKVGPDFSDAIARLTALRDTMIRVLRGSGAEPGDAPELQRLNAILTVVISGHYPLGKVPWPQLEGGRKSLAALLTELAAHPVLA